MCVGGSQQRPRLPESTGGAEDKIHAALALLLEFGVDHAVVFRGRIGLAITAGGGTLHVLSHGVAGLLQSFDSGVDRGGIVSLFRFFHAGDGRFGADFEPASSFSPCSFISFSTS